MFTFKSVITSKKTIFCRSLMSSRDLTLKMATSFPISEEMKKESELLKTSYPVLVDSLMMKSKFSEQPDVANWLKKILDYNLFGGKMTRGLSTILAYNMLKNNAHLNNETQNLVASLAWCVEMYHAYLIVFDDLIDRSKLRRGAPCWHLLPGVSLGAINDAILIQTAIYETLRINFEHKPIYTQLLKLLNETHLYTIMGQHLDYTISSRRDKKDYTKFTKESHETIAKYKSGYYSFDLPIRLAMYMANITDENLHSKTRQICLSLGHLYQIQDDFIDGFVDPAVSGKDGSDIQEGKCTWLAVTALERVNANQRVVFEACYGSKETAHIERIKQLYRQLSLQDTFYKKEKEMYDAIVQQSKALPRALPSGLFIKFADMIHKRNQGNYFD